MKKTIIIIVALIAAFGLGYCSQFLTNKFGNDEGKPTPLATKAEPKDHLKLGAFSVSLNVKNLQTSQVFYENLGFTTFAGNSKQHYLIMKNGNTLIGLFQGMFEKNMLTFNPGWDENAKNIDPFDDVRTIQQHLQNTQIKLTSEADAKTAGPASITLTDPDSNIILIDQHR